MSMVLRAPAPAFVTAMILPDPNFDDSEAAQNSVATLFTKDGTLYTYVKSNARSKLHYDLTLDRMKAEELSAFIQAYYRAPVQIVNHKGEVWNVYFLSNPFEFEDASARVSNITLEFEGTKVT
jgi:hypothetical protein